MRSSLYACLQASVTIFRLAVSVDWRNDTAGIFVRVTNRHIKRRPLALNRQRQGPVRARNRSNTDLTTVLAAKGHSYSARNDEMTSNVFVHTQSCPLRKLSKCNSAWTVTPTSLLKRKEYRQKAPFTCHSSKQNQTKTPSAKVRDDSILVIQAHGLSKPRTDCRHPFTQSSFQSKPVKSRSKPH